MVKKKMVKEGTCYCPHPNHKGYFIIGGIVAILLGLGVWNEQWLTLSQLFAIVFVLMGIKKIVWGFH